MLKVEEIFHDKNIDNAFSKMDGAAWFDIETTGLSADVSKVYLIGIAEVTDDGIRLTQLFANDLNSESEILNEFSDFSKRIKNIIHYNGDTFDLPFIRKRCEKLGIDYDDSHLVSIDIYKKMKPFKELFGLPNLHQPTVEALLNTGRVDETNGGELIEVYSRYIKYALEKNDKADELKKILLLHNHDDVKGLTGISRILEFDREMRDIEGYVSDIDVERTGEEMNFSFDLPFIPADGEIHKGPYSLYISRNGRCLVSVPIINEELKLFYSDYKNYRYLINEGKIIHNSIAQFMDKSLVRRVKAEECFTTYRSSFIPGPSEHLSPVFLKEYRGKEYFIELNDRFVSSADSKLNYCREVIHYIFYGKKT